MKLILITPEKNIPNETALLISMLEAGLPYLHLRKPGMPEANYRAMIQAIPVQYHQQIIIQTHYTILNEFSVGGIHFNSHERHNAADFSGRKGLRSSASFHGWEELRENELPFHHVYISPVFDSISKKGYQASIDLIGADAFKRYNAANGRLCPELIGLGGVNAANWPVLVQNGFDGGAVLGSVWQAEDPLSALQSLLRLIN